MGRTNESANADVNIVSTSFLKSEEPAQIVFWNDADLSSAGDYFTCHLDVDDCY